MILLKSLADSGAFARIELLHRVAAFRMAMRARYMIPMEKDGD
jgi:hypothetical protein